MRHHVATQHNALPSDTFSRHDNELENCSNDSAIGMESDNRTVNDMAVQCHVEVISTASQQHISTRDSEIQVEIPNEKVTQLQEHITELERQGSDTTKLLSSFYIPVDCSSIVPELDHLRDFLNLVTSSSEMTSSKETEQRVALYPGDERGPEQGSYLTAANNSPASVVRQSDVVDRFTRDSMSGRDEERFSSFDSDVLISTEEISEDLRLKLDLAYKVKQRTLHIWDNNTCFFVCVCVYI